MSRWGIDRRRGKEKEEKKASGKDSKEDRQADRQTDRHQEEERVRGSLYIIFYSTSASPSVTLTDNHTPKLPKLGARSISRKAVYNFFFSNGT